jgi:carbamoyl-phosphate synthase small subunit
MTPAKLILEDGTTYEGESFGATADTIGEVVFNTSLTGYQEIATDPSYRFQIVVMTYPHIGNYGVESIVEQSEVPQVAGFVVRDAVAEPSNAHAQMSLGDYFTRAGISAISGVDTRALTRKIRNEGAMRGMITTNADRSVDSIVASCASRRRCRASTSCSASPRSVRIRSKRITHRRGSASPSTTSA